MRTSVEAGLAQGVNAKDVILITLDRRRWWVRAVDQYGSI
jgi:hypothetical protein